MEEERNLQAPTAADAPAVDPWAAAFEGIARQVRADSTHKSRLTPLESVAPLLPDPHGVRTAVGGMAAKPEFQDINLISSHAGLYVYSERSIARHEAERLAYDEEVRAQIVDRVRRNSSPSACLTNVDTLGALIPGAEKDRIDVHLLCLVDDPRYGDVRLITNSRGQRYLYSSEAMTGSYAEILARAGANDPVATIATTVREESKTYPRPTTLRAFEAPAFGIDASQIESYLATLFNTPEYADIKKVQASTGAIYLYSNRHVNGNWARAMVEWEEVGQYENP
jgi:hypothetical protein